MIIECPACKSRYRIREDKLPSEGGNIKCPNCAHIFFVPRKASSAASVSASVPAIPSDPVPPLDLRAESGAEPVADADSDAGKRWKLKNPVGLVYDFPDTEQIRNWLYSRESFDGIQVSSDGGNTWRGIAEEPELSDVKATGTKVLPQPTTTRNSARRVTGPQAAKTVEQLKAEAEARLVEARRTRQEAGSEKVHYNVIKPPATKEAERTGRLLLALAIFVLPLLAAVGLHSSGVINLRNIEFFQEPNPEGPVGVALPDRGYLPPEVEEVDSPLNSITTDQAVATLINQAGAAQARGENAVAIRHLENAISLVPDDLELSCLLAPIYEVEQRTGDAGLAAERCASGDNEGSGAEGSGAGTQSGGAPTGQEGATDPSEQTP